VKGYDDWKTDTPDNHLEVHTHCRECRTPIHIGEEFISSDAGDFCNFDSTCFENFCKDYLTVRILVGYK
jgi:predicted nucleic acid-binding Zn ribbon protein